MLTYDDTGQSGKPWLLQAQGQRASHYRYRFKPGISCKQPGKGIFNFFVGTDGAQVWQDTGVVW